MTKHPIHHGMFHVSVSATRDGQRADAVHSIQITDDVIAICLFDRHNPEIFVKVLDGRAVNGHQWVFTAGMTDLECQVTVEEASTGTVRIYRSVQGEPFQPVSDIQAFPHNEDDLAHHEAEKITSRIGSTGLGDFKVFVVVNESDEKEGASYDATLDDFARVLPNIGDDLWFPKGKGRAAHVTGRYFTPGYLDTQEQPSFALECEWGVRQRPSGG